MTLLAVISVAIIAFMPSITKTTVAGTFDTQQSQRAISIFERISRDWSNTLPWSGDILMDNGSPVDLGAFVASEMAAVGLDCGVSVESPSTTTKRVIITCAAGNGLPATTLRAEYGSPGA